MDRPCPLHDIPNFDCIDCKMAARIRHAATDERIDFATRGKCNGFSRSRSQEDRQTVGGFCGNRSPGHLKDKLHLTYEVKGHEVVIVERRPRWDNETEWTETPVANLKFIRSANKWRLYWMRADMKWHKYSGLSSSHRLDVLLQEIDADPLACFFG